MPVETTKLEWDDATLRDPHAAADKSARVRNMFNAIAPTYERVNSVFSLGRDAAWRRTAVRLANVRPGESVLDVACGTGDLARAFARAVTAPGRVMGCDFAHDMLRLALGRGDAALSWCEADALRLPFADASFDIASCAFGVRNFQDLRAGLSEMRRVLRPGGRCVILEFAMPRNAALRRAYELYFRQIMPRLAARMSGDRTGAYRYLPHSVVSFTSPDELRDLLTAVGFAGVTVNPMTLGIVNIFVATTT